MSYADLIERLEKLEGFDRELDLEIGLTVGGWSMRKDADFGTLVYVPEDVGSYPPVPGAMYPSFTESLDAAVALVARVLPGCEWTTSNNTRHPLVGPYAEVVVHRPTGDSGYCATHAASPTPAIALLIATLKALDQQHE